MAGARRLRLDLADQSQLSDSVCAFATSLGAWLISDFEIATA